MFPNSDKLCTYKGGWYYDQKNYRYVKPSYWDLFILLTSWSEAFVWYAKASELNPYDSLYPTNAALCLNLLGKEREAL
jgi:hypothetical protein